MQLIRGMSVVHESMDTSLLPALVALLELQSVSAAAAQLGVTQPAMSRTLAKLRAQLGDELLVKVGRGVTRTARGEALLAPARTALTQAVDVLSPPEKFDPVTATGTVTIAMGEDMQAVAAGAVLLELRKRAPGLVLRLKPLAFSSTDDARRGVIDLAVMPLLTPKELPDLSDFVIKPLYERRFVTVGRRARKPTLVEFCALDHVLVSFGDDVGYVDKALAARGLKRRVAVTVQGFGVALQVLRASEDMVSTVPADVVAALAPRLNTWPCPVETPRFPMCLTWLARESTNPRHRFVRDVVRAAILKAVRRTT
jgi:DNA-binding transcriptional LysR family regulator